MFRLLVVSRELEKPLNPLVRLVDAVEDDEAIYFIHTIELASELYEEFDFCNNNIKDNIYWFQEQWELDDLIVKVIKNKYDLKWNICYDTNDIHFVNNYIFYFNKGERYYFLDDNLLHIDFDIVNKINNDNMSANDFIMSYSNNFISADLLKVPLKESGFIDEYHSLDKILEYAKKFGIDGYVLYFMREVWENRNEIEYNMDGEYNNPFKNILLVEDYLNKQEFYNIDLVKCKNYDIDITELPVKFNYHGFYTTTGRIYSSGNGCIPIQNLPKVKRDVLYAPKGCVLVEIDFKSFEFDILCQLLEVDIEDDPHTSVYERLVGIDHPNKRDIGKRINYSYIYGMNPGRLADSIINDIGYLDDDFKDNFLEKLVNEDIALLVGDFQNNISADVKNGQFQNYFGRIIQFKKSYAILNNYISSTATDFLYNKFLCVVDLMKKYHNDKNRILLQEHDSILLQLDVKCIDDTDIFESILGIMQADLNGLSARIEYKYGQDWKNLK